MNTDLLLEIAEAIEAQPEKFDLNYFFRLPDPDDGHVRSPGEFYESCGTTACIAGWACVLTNNVKVAAHDIHETARDLLGLTETQAWNLFYAGSKSRIWNRLADEYGWDREQFDGNYSQITAYEAADVLKRIAKGDVEL